MSFNIYEIDTKALIDNVKKIKLHLKENTKLCAMVKADAYGHGIDNIAIYIDSLVDYFGVANTKEARELREIGIKSKILVVGELLEDDIMWCAINNVSLSVGSIDDAIKLRAFASLPINVHIKINTGMNRYGFYDKNVLKRALYILSKNNNIKIEGIFTHYATKDENKEFIIHQTEQFYKMINGMKLKNVIIHTSSSYPAIYMSSLNFDMCRVGYYIYGGERTFLSLKPVLTIKSQIVKINHIKAGESVGYSRTFIAKRDSIIAVIPLGYADGFDRRLSNKGYVLINGKKAKVVGRVCMDVFFVDITDIDNVNCGDEVIILGRSGNVKITYKNYAKWLDTSEYDIMLKFRYRRMNVLIK